MMSSFDISDIIDLCEDLKEHKEKNGDKSDFFSLNGREVSFLISLLEKELEVIKSGR